jgi:hypothetical protein
VLTGEPVPPSLTTTFSIKSLLVDEGYTSLLAQWSGKDMARETYGRRLRRTIGRTAGELLDVVRRRRCLCTSSVCRSRK